MTPSLDTGRRAAEPLAPLRGTTARQAPDAELQQRFDAALGRQSQPVEAPDREAKGGATAWQPPRRDESRESAARLLPRQAVRDQQTQPATPHVVTQEGAEARGADEALPLKPSPKAAGKLPGIEPDPRDGSNATDGGALPSPINAFGMAPLPVVTGLDAPVTTLAVLPLSATAAAAQRMQAAPMVDRMAPMRIAFGESHSGVSALVVTPSAVHGTADMRVVASNGMQAALGARVDGLRARLVERGLKPGVISVSAQENDDESQD